MSLKVDTSTSPRAAASAPAIRAVLILVLAFTTLASKSASAREDRKTHAGMVVAAVDRYFVPRMEALDKAAAKLNETTTALCSDPSNQTARAEAEKAFADVVRAWSAAELLRAGPLKETNRLERFYFWPDPRGTTARQLTLLVARNDPAQAEPAAIAKQSAALQGLPALEMLLFDENAPLSTADEKARLRCTHTKGIAANIATLAHEMTDRWKAPDGFRAKMLSPGSDNPLYKDAAETGSEVVKALVTGLELAVSRYATPELEAAKATPPKRPRLPFERSGLTLPFLEASIGGIEALFNETGLIAFIPADKPWMEEFVPKKFAEARKSAAALEKARSLAPGDPARLEAARKLKFDLNALRLVIVKELAPAADLTLGFNELDGD